MAVTGARRLIFPGECRLRHRGSERVRQLQSRRREHPGNSHAALRPDPGSISAARPTFPPAI